MAGFEQRGKGPQANVECWWPLGAQKARTTRKKYSTTAL